MINNQILKVKNSIGEKVKLVAISKTKPISDIKNIYDKGQLIFGENRVNELVEKHEALPKDINWHFIGHLQTNKVKYITPFITLIHSVDSLKLMKEINKQAKKNNRIIECLLQFHIAKEDSKFGLNLPMAQKILESIEFSEMKNISICGVMGMASFTDDKQQIKNEFKKLKNYFKILKVNYFNNQSHFEHISMGMSGDYEIAINEGSTMIRIGSLIFGER